MALTVVVRSGDPAAPPSITFDAPRIVIGRGEGCEVRLPDPSVSHRHASIRQRGTEYIVVDEGSTNGTFVGPVKLSPQAPRVLRSGDLIRIGRIWLEARLEHVPPTQNQPIATREMALALVSNALASEGESAAVRVHIVEGPDAGREMLVAEFERGHVIGRGQNVELSVDDEDASRRHLEVIRRGKQLLVRDLGSKNGSRLGEQELDSGKERAWPRGESLFVGKNSFVYEDPVADALEELERAAVDRMRDDESVDPPDAESTPAPAEQDESDADEAPPAESRREAPIATLPERKKPASRNRSGWNTTDVLVALLALLVLGLSVLGLWWLFRSQ